MAQCKECKSKLNPKEIYCAWCIVDIGRENKNLKDFGFRW